MKLKYLYTGILMFALVSGIRTQMYSQLPTNLEVVLNPATPIISTDPDDNSVDSNQLYYYRFVFHVSDTTNISKIHAKIGTSDGGNELLEEWFAFDQAINLPGNVQGYYRETYMISMVVGTLVWHPNIYCEVKLEDYSNNFSPQSKYQIHW